MQVNVPAPEAANGRSGAHDGALEGTEHRDRPHTDDAHRAAIRMARIYGPLHLRSESYDLREQCSGEHNRVAVPSEESFCRAAVFGGHDTMGAAARSNALRKSCFVTGGPVTRSRSYATV